MKTTRIVSIFILALATLTVALPSATAQAVPPVLAIFDPEVKDIAAADGRVFVDALASALFDTGRFTLVDRESRGKTLAEIEFSLSSAADEKAQIAIGKQIAADYIVVGSLGRYGGKIVYTFKTIETESSKVAAAASDIVDNMERLIEAAPDIADAFAAAPAFSALASTIPEGAAVKPEKPATPSRTALDEALFKVTPAGSFPLQFGIFDPVQLMPAATAITGLRLNLGYSRNIAVSFLDIGIVNAVDAEMIGVQAGIVNFTGASRGLQIGLLGFNRWTDLLQANVIYNSSENLSGIQLGLVNRGGRAVGVQIGVVNLADKIAGLQIGLVNVTGLLRGVQIGLANIAAYGPGSRFMPFVNIAL